MLVFFLSKLLSALHTELRELRAENARLHRELNQALTRSRSTHKQLENSHANNAVLRAELTKLTKARHCSADAPPKPQAPLGRIMRDGEDKPRNQR